jgi:hypothetical protein
MFEGRFEDKSFAIELLNRFNEKVGQVVPADRLLLYEVQQD